MKNILSVLALVFTLTFVQQCCAQNDTTFTYQGKLNDNGQPANGNHSFRVALWDAEIGGFQIGNSISMDDQPVSDGSFTIQLDFGGAAFDNNDRWLEITVDGITLVPRQWITRAPYAIQTRGIFVNDDASFVGIGRDEPVGGADALAVYRDTDSFGGMYVETADGGEPFYGYASNNVVDALHYVDGDTGTWHLFNNGNHLNVKRDGFVGVGLEEGAATEVFAIYRDTDGFAGMTVETNFAGSPYYAYGPGGGTFAFHYLDGETGSWHLQSAFANRLTVTCDGHVGINTSDPSHTLHVESTAAGNGIYSNTTDGAAVLGYSEGSNSVGIFGANVGGGLAGAFFGDVQIEGTLSKSGGSFKIDHPLDPSNKFLFHSFVESPDMMNIYNGNVVTNNNGFATINMPEWFDALNRDFRYQLTVIDEGNGTEFVLAKVVQKIRDNHFRIRTSAPNTEVSWQVTGVRQDAWAEANRIPVEEDKEGHEIGHYLHPDVYGLNREMSITAARMGLGTAESEAESSPEKGDLEIGKMPTETHGSREVLPADSRGN